MAASLENTIQEKIKSLPPEKQQRVLSLVEEMLEEKDATVQPVRSRVQRLLDLAASLARETESLARESSVTHESKRLQGRGTVRPLWEIAEQISSQVPLEEWEKLPTDGAEQHDHYLYGSPKTETD